MVAQVRTEMSALTQTRISGGGKAMVFFSWVLILVLVVYCYLRILLLRKPHLTTPLEIDTEPQE